MIHLFSGPLFSRSLFSRSFFTSNGTSKPFLSKLLRSTPLAAKPFVLLLFLLLVLSFLCYMLWEYRSIKTTRLPLDLPAVSGLKIVYASDFQYDLRADNPDSLQGKLFQKAIDRIMAEAPDLILLGGDYADDRGNIPAVLPYLRQLSAPLGVYAVFGNHDFLGETLLAQQLPGIRFLQNESLLVSYQGAKLALCGVEDLWRGNPRLPDLSPEADARILLSHQPDFFETLSQEAARQIDWMLAGHTHGGQITFFGRYGVPPVMRHVSKYGEKYRYGQGRHLGSKYYVSAGLGGRVMGLPLRFGARPEIVVME